MLTNKQKDKIILETLRDLKDWKRYNELRETICKTYCKLFLDSLTERERFVFDNNLFSENLIPLGYSIYFYTTFSGPRDLFTYLSNIFPDMNKLKELNFRYYEFSEYLMSLGKEVEERSILCRSYEISTDEFKCTRDIRIPVDIRDFCSIVKIDENTTPNLKLLAESFIDYFEVIESLKKKLRALKDFLSQSFLTLSDLKTNAPRFYNYLKK